MAIQLAKKWPEMVVKLAIVIVIRFYSDYILHMTVQIALKLKVLSSDRCFIAGLLYKDFVEDLEEMKYHI